MPSAAHRGLQFTWHLPMMRRFDGSRLGYLRTPAAERPYPDIGLLSMASKSKTKDELPDALFRALRAMTRSDHVELERFTARLNLETRKEYVSFLSLHHIALQNLRGDWRPEDGEDFSKMLKCLQDDLSALGASRLKLHPAPRAPLIFSNRLGVAYVIRSIRLDAKQQRGRVAKAFAATYLDFVPALNWEGFLQQLEQGGEGMKAGGSDEVLRGARVAFELYVGLLRQAPV